MECIATRVRLFSFSCAVGVLAVLPDNALANCYFTNGPTSALTRTVSFGTVSVQRDAPVGTVLASANTGAYNGGVAHYGCSVPFTHRYHMEMFSTVSSYGNGVYNTNIAGVGVRVRNYANRNLPFDTPYGGNIIVLIPDIRVQLIKTRPGAVGAGVLTNGRLISGSIVNQFYGAYASLAGVNTIVPVACSVTNAAIPVSMGNVPRSLFNGPGSMGAAVNFSIPLNCDANTRVGLTLEGTAHRSGIGGVLALNTSSSAVATGLGVRLFYNNAPVALRTRINVGTVASNGPYAIPLMARYYQTDSAVTAGEANSTATFTLTYN